MWKDYSKRISSKRKPVIAKTYEIAVAENARFFEPERPCVRGHLAPRLTSNNACTECKRLRHVIVPLVTARSLALAKGESTYTIDKPCPRGHMAPRYTNNRTCTECHRENRSRSLMAEPPPIPNIAVNALLMRSWIKPTEESEEDSDQEEA